jgi:hypothetical protein
MIWSNACRKGSTNPECGDFMDDVGLKVSSSGWAIPQWNLHDICGWLNVAIPSCQLCMDS